LRGEAGGEKVYVHEDRFYEENEIDLRVRTSVAAIDAAAREAVLDSGERLAFDRLLLATGATPRRLSVPGHDLEGIHHLLAGVNVNVWDVTEAIQEQIRSGVRTPAGASRETP
jgi:NAD(P)H-nitrite reductase large subunit